MVQTAARRSGSEARAVDRRHEILEAASRVFRRQGLHATRMRDIAAELGMHVGNLYYYFENKADLLAFCQEETLHRLLAGAAAVGERDLRPDAALYLLVSSHVVELNEGVPGSLAHLEIEAVATERRSDIVRLRDRYERAWRRLIAEGVASGLFREVDPKVATMACLGAANWTVKWFRADGWRSARSIGDEFARLLVGGMMAPGHEVELPEGEESP